ncbi:hypothetical protein [Cupriavidus necator]|uniref:hypothetical protein n=1 Tax=Cupriavidus necator TaxID=106590 RepID=UPI001E3BCDFD|nr:hypothetical protein [Cupriavidus necator]
MQNNRYLLYIVAGTLAFALAGTAVADEGGKTITQRLLEADGKVALQKLELDLAKGAPAPAPVAVPSKSAEAQRAPQTIALYGVDGATTGGPLALRSYVKWGEQLYPAKVGARWRGYTVTAITEAGTTFSRGKSKVIAPMVLDDAAVLFEQKATEPAMGAQSARPASPLPQIAPQILPQMVAPTMPVPSNTVSPATVPLASAQGAAPAVAQR